jgi:hypothetical protein
MTLLVAVSLATGSLASAGQRTWDFTTDPQGDPELQFGLANNFEPWRETDGNPGGFLALTWAVGSQYAGVIFPDIDPGRVVTAFNFKCDLRIGNGSTDRPADGFSISFARDGDPILADINNQANFAVSGGPENGTSTGIAVSFDTWAGNALPDGDDIEGIIVRVDNRTVLRQALPTRHGACDDATSLQTGPRDAAYWTAGGDPYAPEAYDDLCWQPFEINLEQDGTLDVIYKGNRILDNFQTDYFPSAGRLVLAGRTGGSNEATHVDNIQLTTTAVESSGPPTAPPNLQALETGTRRVALTWGESTTPDGTRVAYEVLRGADVIAGNLLETQYEDTGLLPGTAYAYTVRARNLAGEASPDSTLNVTTASEVASIGFLTAQVYDGFTGAGSFDLDTVLADPDFPNSPDRGYYANGMTFGEPALGDTYGNDLAVRIAGIFTAPQTGDYHFFIRSDDASRLYLNTTGPQIPDPVGTPTGTDAPIAEETDCCGPFVEPGTLNTDQTTSPTTIDPIRLTAGQQYGMLFIVKEGGGGDWGQVAYRIEGDPTPAGQLTPIRGAVFQAGMGDPVGASVTITDQPDSVTLAAYKSVSFSVAAETESPYDLEVLYQWYRDGQPIPHANQPTYTIEVVQPGDDGALFTCLVAVPGASATSAEATLTVTAGEPAQIVSATATDTFDTVTLRFDQPVTEPSATTAANYTLDNGATVSAASLADPYTVELTTSQLTPGTDYTVTVSNVQNLGGTPVAANTTGTFTSFTEVPGEIRVLFYTNIGGTVLADLTNSVKFPNLPDDTQTVTNLASPDGYGENYGVMLRGYVTPPETGQYRFFIRSDDSSAIWLNTSGATPPDPTESDPIASETDCCEGFQEPGVPNDDGVTFPVSEPVSLTAGTQYGVTVLMKEGGGGDYVHVAWRPETSTTPAADLTDIPSSAIGTYISPTAGGGLEVDSIALQGGNVVITYSQGVLQAATSVTGPYTDVAGATSPYSTAPTGSAMFFRLRE